MKYKILFFDIVHIVLIIAGYHYYKIKAFFALSNEKEDIMSKQSIANSSYIYLLQDHY